MESPAKRLHFVTADPERVLELLEERESDNEGLSSDEESELDHELENESGEMR